MKTSLWTNPIDSCTHQLGEDVELVDEQTDVDDEHGDGEVEAHVLDGQPAIQQVHELQRLHRDREAPVQVEQHEEPRRVPHLHVVVVYDGRHGAEQRQHVRDEEVEVRALVERVRDDALSDLQDVGDGEEEGEDPAHVVPREVHPRLGVDAADVRLVPCDQNRHRHQHEEDVRLQRQAVQETLVGENAVARHTRGVTELLTELHRESDTDWGGGGVPVLDSTKLNLNLFLVCVCTIHNVLPLSCLAVFHH